MLPSVPTNRQQQQRLPAKEMIDSPLFNQNSMEENSGQNDNSSPFTISQDPSLPPPESEAPYEVRETRRSVISAVDMEVLDETDFADTGKNFDKTPEDIKKIIRNIRSVVLFEGYHEDELQLVASYMYNRSVKPGEIVIEYGGNGDAFYVVKSGKYRCTVPKPSGGHVTVRIYNGDGYFGELALLNHAPRAATITAATEGQLWVLDALRNAWLRKQRAISNAERFEQVIKTIPLFRDILEPSLTNCLIDAIEVIYMSAGDVICRQGDPGDAMYFILEGEVEVIIDNRPVKIMQKNEFFGERALVLDEGRAATCKAVSNKLQLAKLPKESFGLLMPDAILDRMRDHIEISYAAAAAAAAAAAGGVASSDEQAKSK